MVRAAYPKHPFPFQAGLFFSSNVHQCWVWVFSNFWLHFLCAVKHHMQLLRRPLFQPSRSCKGLHTSEAPQHESVGPGSFSMNPETVLINTAEVAESRGPGRVFRHIILWYHDIYGGHSTRTALPGGRVRCGLRFSNPALADFVIGLRKKKSKDLLPSHAAFRQVGFTRRTRHASIPSCPSVKDRRVNASRVTQCARLSHRSPA